MTLGRGTPTENDPEGLVAIGRVARPFGLKGQFVVEPLTDFPDRFAAGNSVLIKGRRLKITECQPRKNRWALKLEGIDDLHEAKGLSGQYLEIRESELRPLPEGQYYRFQIVGLRVVTPSGKELGRVAEVLETGGNDVYLVRGPEGEHLVPASSHFVTEIDLSTGCMVVDLPGAL